MTRSAYIIIAHDGTEIIDATSYAKSRIAAMDYLEKRFQREQERKQRKMRKLAKNPLWKFACFCGIV